MEKKDYEKEAVWLHLDGDLKLGHDVNVAFWKDPSQHYTFALLRTTRLSDIDKMSPEEIQQANAEYFAVASKILLDCDLNGVDFTTPKSTEEAFNNDELPWGIFHEALLAYASKLITEYQVLKNLLRRVGVLSNSGTSNEQEEEE